MTTIYKTPASIDQPIYTNKTTYNEACKYYLSELKDYVTKNNNSESAGEILSFNVMDGKAYYMVMTLKPLKLMHIELKGSYTYNDAAKLTPTQVKKLITIDKILKK